jgi:hypothetical protein
MNRLLNYDLICFTSSVAGGMLFSYNSSGNYKDKLINFSVGNTVGYFMGVAYPISYPIMGLYGSYSLYKKLIE